ncbi:MAG: hypothetical protein KGZ80_02395 [Methylomonas sp.]|nr:hypothetical protein [Methylomonas sp.]PPD19757.1 MAG: hypothetical protein CTY23_10890 [Methylomonas sp.]PPD25580.1 MAG: hypothetical protein CTY22_08040 [Methylomonas sp.]PPD36480.1 MAG: hypothetical protein CTY21_08040 [Methylomonas sp.]PPD40957.1 MAG: hypothetical protein CTY17_04900 [Methylomonas sp.]
MLQEQIIAEIKQIPDDKLAEIYDLIHYFRLGLSCERVTSSQLRPIGLVKHQLEIPPAFYDPLPDDVMAGFEGKSSDNAISN